MVLKRSNGLLLGLPVDFVEEVKMVLLIWWLFVFKCFFVNSKHLASY